MTYAQPLSLSDRQSLMGFRHVAAGFIWSLINARLTAEPDFLEPAELKRWDKNKVRKDAPCIDILRWVKQRKELVKGIYEGGLNSYPYAETAEKQLERLLCQVGQFVCGDLDEAIRQAAKGQPVAWESLAHWDWLREMRDALDRLPEKETRVPDPQQEKRIAVDREKAIVYIDKSPYPLNGTETAKKRLAEFIEELIEADGGFVSMTAVGVKTDHIQRQPQAVRDLLESQPGAGTRIPRDKLYKQLR